MDYSIAVNSLSFVATDAPQARRLLIDNVSFGVPSGVFTAIIGPSGCGKSTLLKILGGLLPGSSGTVALAGHAPGELREQFPLAVGYLPQFSAFHLELSVREVLQNSLDLRMPTLGSGPKGEQWLMQVAGLAGLTPLMEQSVSTLSGGELRRLALAEELLGDPPFVFLDELTSGLDPHAERGIMYWLANLVRETGKTVVIVTHAIASLHLCDRVIFLDSGRLLYCGPTEQMRSYFGLEALEDVYERAAQFGPMPKQLLELGEQGQPQPIGAGKPSSFLRQLPTLVARQVKLMWRDRGQLWLQVLLLVSFPGLVAVFALNGLPEVRRLSLQVQTNVAEGLIERLQFLKDSFHVSSLMAGMSMFQVILLTLMGSNNSAREIAKERKILRKELRSGLSPLAYLCSKAGQLVIFAALQAAWMTGFVKLMCGFPGELEKQFLILFLATLAMSCTCLWFSAFSRSPEKASLLSIYLVGLQLPLSGAVLALPDWLKWMTRPFIAAYWGWSGYLRTFESYRHFDVVKQNSKTDIASYQLSVVVLCVHVVAALAATLIALHRKRRELDD